MLPAGKSDQPHARARVSRSRPLLPFTVSRFIISFVPPFDPAGPGDSDCPGASPACFFLYLYQKASFSRIYFLAHSCRDSGLRHDTRSTMALILPFILTLWSLCIATVTTTPQLCYTEAGVLAPDYIVPCWPSQKAQQYSCCKIGDKCLDHSACYNAQTGVTYQYGCTDSAYRDPNICPTKCGLDGKKSNYVGMVFCNGSRGLPTDTWV